MAFEVFDHTADVGLRVRASSIDALFAEAATALYSLIVTNPADLRPVLQKVVHLTGGQYDLLLFDWLNELLYLFESDLFLACRCDVHVEDAQLRATLAGEPADPVRHRLEHEVKAITYHGLRVEENAGGWLAEVIVDI